MDNKEDVLLGAGEVYMYEFNGTELPKDSVIESLEHNVGYCSGGFKFEYKPKKYDVKNQYGKIVKSVITSEEITAKTGILTWDLTKLSLLSTAKITIDSAEKKRKLTFGGGGSLKTVLIRFVHTKDNGKKIRFTMIGQGGNGFALQFGEKEVTIDSQIQAISYVKNFLASVEEELTDEEFKELQKQ